MSLQAALELQKLGGRHKDNFVSFFTMDKILAGQNPYWSGALWRGKRKMAQEKDDKFSISKQIQM